MNDRLRVAWFSPLSGGSVAAYSTRLLAERLAESVDLTLFHAGERRQSFCEEKPVPVHHYLNAVELDRADPFDLFFYNLEDRKDCDFCRIHLALRPGMVWFHDFFLSTHGPEPILNSSWREIVRRFSDPQTGWPDRDLEHTPAGVLAEREAGMSFSPLFSNPRDHAEYQRLVKIRIAGDETRSFLQRHPVPEHLFASDRSHSKRQIDRIALSGMPRIESQVHQFFTALELVEYSGKVVWPQPAGEVSRARELVNEFGLEETVEIVMGEGPDAWQNIIGGCDLGVHLRFSAFGQPSPFLPMTLAAGLPALVTDFAAGAAYPDSVVFKLTPGATQARQIAGILRSFETTGTAAYSENSRSYSREYFHPAVVAQELVSIFNHEQERSATLSGRWRELESAARAELMRESRELAREASAFLEEKGTSLVDPVYKELGWL